MNALSADRHGPASAASAHGDVLLPLANIRSLWYICSCARHSDGTAEQRFAPYQLKVGGCGKNVPLPRKTLTGCTNLAACQPANGPPFHPPFNPPHNVGGTGGASGRWVNRCYEIWKDKPNPLRIG